MKTPPKFGGVFAFFWEEFAFKFGFIGLWPKFGIRNSEFGIKERGGNSTLIISVNVVDRKGFFEDAEVRLRLSLSSPRNSEFRIPNSELDR